MQIIRVKELKKLIGVSEVTIWRWIKEGNFPAGIQLGGNTKGWLASDIEEWLNSKKEASMKRRA